MNITKENNFLIPDNYQEDRKEKVVNRTSSTNIGLGMLAIISSYDLGFESLEKCVDLLEKMINIQNDMISAIKYNHQTGLTLTESITILSELINTINNETLNLYVKVENLPSYLLNYALKTDLFSRNYNDLNNKPIIPTKVSDLSNDLRICNIKFINY